MYGLPLTGTRAVKVSLPMLLQRAQAHATATLMMVPAASSSRIMASDVHRRRRGFMPSSYRACSAARLAPCDSKALASSRPVSHDGQQVVDVDHAAVIEVGGTGLARRTGAPRDDHRKQVVDVDQTIAIHIPGQADVAFIRHAVAVQIFAGADSDVAAIGLTVPVAIDLNQARDEVRGAHVACGF